MQAQKPEQGHTFLRLNRHSQVVLSVIPTDWKVSTIREITREHKQGFYTNESYTNNGMKLVRITDLLNPRLSYETMPSLNLDEKTIKEFRIHKGDFLVARSGAIGRFGILNEDIPCVFGSYIIRFVFDSRTVDNNFFGFLFQTQTIKKQLLIIQQGSSNININAENIKSMKIALPKKIEQQKIASILSKVDELIQKTDQVIEQTQRLKKGLINKLVNRGLKISRFAYRINQAVPNDHQLVKLADVSIVNPNYTYEDGVEYPFVEMAAVNETTKTIDYYSSRVNSSGYASFKQNDTLFARITPSTEHGKVSFITNFKGLGLGSTELIVLSPKEKLLGEFLYYYCQTDAVRNYAVSQMGGSTGRQRVPDKVFSKDLYILLPPLNKQQRITEVIRGTESILKILRNEKKRLEILKKGLMQKLLTGKIRVKV